MLTLGVSYGYHDASAALAQDGKLLAASTEERLSRRKHDSSFPSNAIQMCLRQSQTKMKDVEYIVYHENPYEKFTRILTTLSSRFPFTSREFSSAMQVWLQNKLWILNRLSLDFQHPPEKVYYLDHHFSHAANAFIGSGFDDASIYINDAVGDWSCTSLYHAWWENNRPQFKKIKEIPFPHSLCLAYSTFTDFLGFKPNDSECSTMALASFGEPQFYEDLKQMFELKDDVYLLNQKYFNFIEFYKKSYTSKFQSVLGEKRSHKDRIPLSCFDNTFSKRTDLRHANIASSIQKIFSEINLHYVNLLARDEHSKNLCLAGGGAMNCVSNSYLMKHSPFSRFYIPPDPGDGGSSAGAALYVSLKKSAKKTSAQELCYTPFQGESFNSIKDLEFVSGIDAESVFKYEKTLNPGAAYRPWRVTSFSDRELLAKKIGELLLANKVVGLLDGRHELGPRALGARSILARPDKMDIAQKISEHIKKRASFRPYAVSILQDCAEKSLELPQCLQLARWMQTAVAVKPEYHSLLQSTMHIDKTTRPQIVDSKTQPFYATLLETIKNSLGIGAVLNTSFNESGMPLVTSPIDALAMFSRTSMDALVCDNLLIEKVDNA